MDTNMEVQINREILSYKEGVLFGLSPRQCLFGALTIGCTAGMRALLGTALGGEVAGWVGIILGAPLAAMGFITYHGMPAEKVALAFLRTLFRSRNRVYCSENYLLQAWRSVIVPMRGRKGKNHGKSTIK
jgi:hypothetical protein